MEGLRVGVTSAGEARELSGALERRGAVVTWGPTVEGRVATGRDLLAQIDRLLAAEPSWVVASTGVGVRAWAEVAERHGRLHLLEATLRRARVVARRSKALGALRWLGVDPVFVSAQETDEDVATWLRQRLLPGDRVAVQVRGAGSLGAYQRLVDAGGEVLPLVPCTSVPPADLRPARELVRRACAGVVDVVVCTSPSAAGNLMRIAADIGVEGALVTALGERVAAAAVGMMTAASLENAGVPVAIMPPRPRTGELVGALGGWAASGRQLPVPAVRLDPAGRAVIADGCRVELGHREFGVLAALVRRPHVACRLDLLAVEAWGHRAPDNPRLIKHQVGRLRRKLGCHGRSIETVRGVGYRYAPPSAGGSG
ncbi:MAG: uroporphyrinogen-III synthase [Actinobacteria bacterium]|nr:uroporphyrinogen-III synthase [Actinomycetota bacterium]